jgi:hypothetical protein
VNALPTRLAEALRQTQDRGFKARHSDPPGGMDEGLRNYRGTDESDDPRSPLCARPANGVLCNHLIQVSLRDFVNQVRSRRGATATFTTATDCDGAELARTWQDPAFDANNIPMPTMTLRILTRHTACRAERHLRRASANSCVTRHGRACSGERAKAGPSGAAGSGQRC